MFFFTRTCVFNTVCYSDGFDQAKAVAAKSDVVVVVLGLAFDQYCMGKGSGGANDFCECEGQDRDSIGERKNK